MKDIFDEYSVKKRYEQNEKKHLYPYLDQQNNLIIGFNTLHFGHVM